MKGLVPLVGLIGTTVFVRVFKGVVVARSRPGTTEKRVPRPRIHVAAVLLAAAVFALLALLAVALNAPGYLQSTHPSVVAAKLSARETCAAAQTRHDLVSAEAAIRDNSLSKDMHRVHVQQTRDSLDRVLRRVNNVVLFGFGVTWAILPPLVAMALLLAHNLLFVTAPLAEDASGVRTQQGVAEPVESALPMVQMTARWVHSVVGLQHEEVWSLMLPVVDMGLGMAWVAYLSFYLWLEERQVSACMLLSGHWFTASCTLLAMMFIASVLVAHALTERPVQRHQHSVAALAVAYSAYTALFVALTLRVLINSQMFHHDDVESREGIKAALTVMPLMVVAVSVVISFSADWVPLSNTVNALREAAGLTISPSDRPEASRRVETTTARQANLGADAQPTTNTASEDHHQQQQQQQAEAQPTIIPTGNPRSHQGRLPFLDEVKAPSISVKKPPPPSTTNDGTTGESRASLLDAITRGVKLKPPTAGDKENQSRNVERSSPPSTSHAERSMQDVMRDLLFKRRSVIEVEADNAPSPGHAGASNDTNDVDDNDDDDGWADDE